MQHFKKSTDWWVPFQKNEEKHLELNFWQRCPLFGHFGLFFLIKKRNWYQKKIIFFAIHSIPQMFLLSYLKKKIKKNKNYYINFQFLHILRRRLQSRQGAAPGSKAVGDASFVCSPNKFWMVSRSKNIKMFQQYLPENTLENKFYWNIAHSSQRLLLTVILEGPVNSR